jgi:hypothetical protein
MQPKNLQVFLTKSQELIKEIDEITTTLATDYKLLALRKNAFRQKCGQFIKISFNETEWFEKFTTDIFETTNIDYTLERLPNKVFIEQELKQFELAKVLLSDWIDTCKFIDSVICDLPTGVDEQGLFFKGQYYDAIFKLSEIIKRATTEIKIVDNYINEDLINFLLKDNIGKIKIITSNKNSKTIQNLKLLLNSIDAQYQNVEIRENNNFHDRFIIIDNNQAYHFGASLKDLGSKTFMFSNLNEPDLLATINSKFDNEWNTSNVIFP